MSDPHPSFDPEGVGQPPRAKPKDRFTGLSVFSPKDWEFTAQGKAQPTPWVGRRNDSAP
jgi:hypothetical protein